MFSLQNREKKQILFTEKLEPKKVSQFLLIDAQTLNKVKEEPSMHIQLCSLRDHTESLKLITSVVFLLVITVTEDIKHNIVLSAVVRYLWLKSLSPQELHKDMVTSLGDSVYFYTTVKTWTRRESGWRPCPVPAKPPEGAPRLEASFPTDNVTWRTVAQKYWRWTRLKRSSQSEEL